MVMSLWWVTLLLLVVAVLAWAIAYRNRRTLRSKPVIVANSEFLDSLPSVRRMQRTSHLLRLASLILAALLVVMSSVLAGRIASERVESPDFATRDIVLCLDVSGSMLSYDKEIIETFSELVENFDGERVGLAIFSSTTRTVFPLTNDYGLVRRQLEHASEALEYNPTSHRLGTGNYSAEQVKKFEEFVGPTVSEALPPSLIGDGVASCGQMFDQADKQRSRFMVLATDNEPGGQGVYDLPAATKTLRERKASMWTFYPGGAECGSSCANELEQESKDTGGGFWESRDPAAIPEIITQIEKAQAVEMGAVPQILRTDHPVIPFVLSALVTVIVIAVGWKGR